LTILYSYSESNPDNGIPVRGIISFVKVKKYHQAHEGFPAKDLPVTTTDKKIVDPGVALLPV
jgi:hypothetical protein